VLSDGRYSPGAVLLIESEQQLLNGTGAATDSGLTVAEAVDNAEIDLTLDSVSGLYANEIIAIDGEQMRVVDVRSATSEITVVRGYNATQVATHDTGTAIYVYRTFNVLRGVNGTAAAEHAGATEVVQIVPPDDINYLCRQIATLMFKKAQGGYAGKTGNAELGEVFYNNEYPKDVIKAIKAHFRIVQL
jgi:hypothetical protein